MRTHPSFALRNQKLLCVPHRAGFFDFQDPEWLFVVDGEVDQGFNRPSGSLLAWRSRINGVIEGSLTWRLLIDYMELPWLGSYFYILMVALP